MQKSSRLWLNAQAMRLLAAFFIVYIHLEPILVGVGINIAFVEILRIGTDCFLVLTAFLSIYRNPFTKQEPLDWLWRRLTRIIPLYWVLTLIFYVSKNLILGPKNHDTFEHFIKSIFFIPYETYPLLFPGWSLTLIIEFAIIFAVSNKLFPRNGSIIATVVAGILGTVGIILKSKNPFLAEYAHPMLIDFFFGGLLALVIARVEKFPLFFIRASGVVSFVSAGVILLLTRHMYVDLPRVFTLGVPALLIVSGCLLMECGEWSVKSRWIVIAARYTFCVYLGHMFWDISFDVIAVHASQALTVTLLIFTPVPVIAGAIALHHLVELPLRKAVELLPYWFVVSRAQPEPKSV